MAFFDKGSCTRGCFDVCFLDICAKQTCLESRCSLNELLNRYMWLQREVFHLNLLGTYTPHGYKCTKCKKILKGMLRFIEAHMKRITIGWNFIQSSKFYGKCSFKTENRNISGLFQARWCYEGTYKNFSPFV